MTGQQAQKLTELGLFYESYLSVCKTGRSDPVTRMTRLAEKLEQEDYCAGKRFYLAGFSDFTSVQLQILDAMLPQAEEMRVSLHRRLGFGELFLRHADGEDAFAHGGQAECRGFRACASKRKRIDLRRSRSGSRMLEPGGAAMDEQAEAVTLSQADSPAHACELAAGVIQKLVRSGARWREIAVAYTDEGYVRALRPMLQRAGIGAYFAGTVDILQKAAVTGHFVRHAGGKAGFRMRM